MSMIKVYSLTQPWASLMAWGEKYAETRGRPNRTLIGHDLVIAATTTIPPEVRELCGRGVMREVLARHGITRWQQLPRGVLLCRVHVVAVVETAALPIVDGALTLPPALARGGAALAPEELHFGNYLRGRYAYLTDPKRLQCLHPIAPTMCTAAGCKRCGPKGDTCPCLRGRFFGRAAGGLSTWQIDERYLIPAAA